MKAIIDSSTLISLAKIDALWVFGKMDCELLCPEEVYEECVIKGALGGRVDAVIIKRLFDEGTVTAMNVLTRKIFSGLSCVDCLVLSLALQEKAAFVFANDTKLARRVELAGLEARGSPDILLRMRSKGLLDDERYISMLMELRTKMRLSADNVIKYLEVE
jgi:predicted nucleic acid-binding protein